MTYFLMLLFVWVTLAAIADAFLVFYQKDSKEVYPLLMVCLADVLYASLGTFFFHSIM